MEMEGDGGRIGEARFALGGVAHKPWRDPEAEAMLRDQAPDRPVFERAAEHALRGAKGHGHNGFKIGLARRAVVRALEQVAAGTPQSQTDKRIR
jgi:xanthine dehydrogenase YagS FAD-binding subunit